MSHQFTSFNFILFSKNISFVYVPKHFYLSLHPSISISLRRDNLYNACGFASRVWYKPFWWLGFNFSTWCFLSIEKLFLFCVLKNLYGVVIDLAHNFVFNLKGLKWYNFSQKSLTIADLKEMKEYGIWYYIISFEANTFKVVVALLHMCNTRLLRQIKHQDTRKKNCYMKNWDDSLTFSLSLKRFTNLPQWFNMSFMSYISDLPQWFKPTKNNTTQKKNTKLLLKVYSPYHHSSHSMVFSLVQKKKSLFYLKPCSLFALKTNKNSWSFNLNGI